MRLRTCQLLFQAIRIPSLRPLALLPGTPCMALLALLAALTHPVPAGAEAREPHELLGPRLDLARIIAGAMVAPLPYALRMPLPPPPLEDSKAIEDARRAGGLAVTDRTSGAWRSRLYRPPLVPLTRPEAAMKGLGQGTTVGWVLGALGSTAGLWDRETWA